MLIPQKIVDEIPVYKSNLNRFLSGELQEDFFRGIRVPWGFYAQRGGKLVMARVRVPNGILTGTQLERLGRVANRLADGALHLTTRQDIQIHNLPVERTIDLIVDLQEVNLSPRAGGGNTIRNITGCYRSGICADEKHEVYRTVWGLTEYLLSLDVSYAMPRKIKIAFSGCERDCALTGVNDIGFIAHADGFKVLCGGGMGAKSIVGMVLHEAADEQEIGYIAKAIIHVFNAYGDRKKKHHNRLRFLIGNLGWERFRQLYREELQGIKDTEHIELRTADELPRLPAPDGSDRNEDALLYQNELYQVFRTYHTEKQKQDGYYAVHLSIPLGEISGDTCISLAGLSATMPALSFRTSQRQNLVIANVPESGLPQVYAKVSTLFNLAPSPTAFIDSICCKGATTCNLGICNSVGLASELTNHLGSIKLNPETMREVTLNVNGCPNACGQHPIGLISFSGMVKKVSNRSVPFYRIHLGGKIDGEKTILAEPVGAAPARSIPAIVSEFIAALQGRTGEDIYRTVTTSGKEQIKALIERYAHVPAYGEDASYYRDLGKAEDFSLDGLTEGECSSGVMDMIESDLESARQLLKEVRGENPDPAPLRSALLFSARALLVVKGSDPRGEIEVINAFLQKFVDSGICSPDFKNLRDVFQSLSGAALSGKDVCDYAHRLYREVIDTYALIDSNVSFPVRYKGTSNDSFSCHSPT
jgi:sulfite reductase (ferredoxin)